MASDDFLPAVRPPYDDDLVIDGNTTPRLVYGRWAVSNDVVRCQILLMREINESRLQRIDKLTLRRLKLYGLRRQTTTAVLNFLRANTSLIQLEIDTLELPWDHGYDLNNVYYNLKVLSIGCIRVVNQSGQELVQLTHLPTITFNAPNLATVYLGWNSIDFVSFASYQSITSLTYGYTNITQAFVLLQYVALQRLNCEMYREMDWPAIWNFVNGASGQLVHLDVSLTRMVSASSMLPQDRLPDLQNLFNLLCYASRTRLMRPQLMNNCHFYGVRLNLDNPNNYSSYHFEGQLVELHYRHFASPHHLPDSPTFPSVLLVQFMDVFFLYNVRSVPGQLPPPPVDHVGYWKFAQLYPNIHTVSLDSRKRPNLIIDRSSFLCFLRCCRALNVLEIKYSSFGGDFYRQLVSIRSCAELKCLTVNERYGTLSPEIDFNHLLESLTQLIGLSTNLATQEVMFNLLKKQPTRRVFKFTFCDPPASGIQPGNSLIEFHFRPMNLNCEYKLLVCRCKEDEEVERPTFIYNGPFSAINPKEQFEKFELNKYATHYLSSESSFLRVRTNLLNF